MLAGLIPYFVQMFWNVVFGIAHVLFLLHAGVVGGAHANVLAEHAEHLGQDMLVGTR